MMRISLTSLACIAVALSACGGHATLVGGDSVRQPEASPPIFEIAVLAGDDLTPVRARIELDGEVFTADASGMVAVVWKEDWDDDPAQLTVSAPGFVAESSRISGLPEEGALEVRLAPVVLQGSVSTSDGRALPLVNIKLGEAEVQTDGRGEFMIVRAAPGALELSRPAWQSKSEDWDGETTDLFLTMEPLMIRALRVSGPKAGDAAAWNELLTLARNSAINALVIDTKDERGRVFHDSSVALAHEIGAVAVAYDLDQVLADMDGLGLYKITRIVTFQDPPLASWDSSIAALNTDTGRAWETDNGRAWLDPTDLDAWEYALDLAEEACRRGFDEIQFDYVRFPTDGPISKLEFDGFSFPNYYSLEAQQARVDTIVAFLSEAHSRLNPMGCAVAADIFAITLESRTDEGIGQMPGPLSSVIDVLSPMIYAYAYEDDWRGFTDPNEHAVEIVGFALDAGLEKLDGFGIYRPWVQRAFLDPDEIRAVQDEVEAHALGWMLWSATTNFNPEMLPQEATE